MASCANGTKYKMCCDDLDLNSRTLEQESASYNMQDTKAGRDIKYNVKEDDFEYFRDIVYKGQCWFCEVRFTNKNPPTLDRIDNTLCYERISISSLNITPLTDEETYHKLRPNITGGFANAFHRYNIKGETHINKLKFEGQYVVSYDLDHIVTHICGYDFNSLYPSVMSGIPHDFIKYTGKRIYMPGYELDRIECEQETQKLLGLNIINNPFRFSNKKSDIDCVTVFIAEVKRHIDYKYINDYIN
ncbi:MAG: hypothetical protein EZS28_036066 [Streblomastix strix]|uniref:Uncharacterized protein n=1 Tax=Streblomastix strix TaxID=222440 RepID=A0A5J4UD61_9EUKA|nr:MAG: hypothetical protein EZS28_036066 [Streblomastix strix]